MVYIHIQDGLRFGGSERPQKMKTTERTSVKEKTVSRAEEPTILKQLNHHINHNGIKFYPIQGQADDTKLIIGYLNHLKKINIDEGYIAIREVPFKALNDDLKKSIRNQFPKANISNDTIVQAVAVTGSGNTGIAPVMFITPNQNGGPIITTTSDFDDFMRNQAGLTQQEAADKFLAVYQKTVFKAE